VSPRAAPAPRRRPALAVVLAAFVVAQACDSPTGPRRMFSVAAVTRVELAGVVRTEVSPAPTVVVTNARGRPVVGAEVRFAVIGGDGIAMRPVTLTDSTGRATSGWVLGHVAGADNRMAASLLTAGPVVFSAVATRGPLSQVVAAGGDLQSGMPGSRLPHPLSARLSDAFDNPLAGVTVSFEVVSGGGSLEAATAVADSSGVATAGRWTLGPSSSEQRVRASVADREVAFTAFGCPPEQVGVTCEGPPQLAFASFTDRQIYTMRMDGSGLRRLTSEGRNMRPVWSPDGRRIAFARIYADVADIYLMDADGSHVVRRTAGAGLLSAAWSPDGRKLAVSSEGIYDGDVWVIPADDDGSSPVHLLSAARSPSWSPDGSRIAYIRLSGDDGYHGVHVVNTDGTGDRELFFSSGGIPGGPSWSPDGKRLVFGNCQSGCDLFVMNADGSDMRRLTALGTVQEAAWSPSGAWIAVSLWNYAVSARDPAVALAYVSADGGAPRVIASGGMHPSWRPLASRP
jgi:hypothetical protein